MPSEAGCVVNGDVDATECLFDEYGRAGNDCLVERLRVQRRHAREPAAIDVPRTSSREGLFDTTKCVST
jgi:hypothetical protein